MKRMKLVFLALCAILLVASCTTFKVSGVQVTGANPAYTKLGDFKTNVWVHEFLGASGGANLINITSDSMDTPIFEAIKREIMKLSGDAAINVTITYQAGLIEIILNGLTGGIYAPATAEITGTIIKYH